MIKEKKRTVSVLLEEEEFKQLEWLCFKNGISKTMFLRLMISETYHGAKFQDVMREKAQMGVSEKELLADLVQYSQDSVKRVGGRSVKREGGK